MKGADWSAYFQTLKEEERQRLLAAFDTLDADPVIRRQYGRDFAELAAFIHNPLQRPHLAHLAASTEELPSTNRQTEAEPMKPEPPPHLPEPPPHLTIALRPTATGYANTLLLIIHRSENRRDRAWATEQIVQAFRQCAVANPEAWTAES